MDSVEGLGVGAKEAAFLLAYVAGAQGDGEDRGMMSDWFGLEGSCYDGILVG